MIFWRGTSVGCQDSSCEQNAMADIRVIRRLAERAHQSENQIIDGHWHPDSPKNRKMLNIIVDSCNAIHGANSCVIEERQHGNI